MDKKDPVTEAPKVQKDDALFETLGKTKKRKKRKLIITVTAVGLTLVIIAVAGVFFLQRQVRNEFASGQIEVISSPVNVGSVISVVNGTGTLAEMDLEAITVPAGVEVTEVLVETNQLVVPGDILAMVDMASVMNTLADLQAQIETLDAQISKAEDDAVSTEVYAGVSGRVKAVYGKTGDNVADVMVANGALALLSLDGYMAVSIQSGSLTEGDSVSIVLSNGKKLAGSVGTVDGSQATVLVTDNGTVYGDKVTVLNSEGTQLGTGILGVHRPLRVTGYAGTISSVKISVEDKVSESTKLFVLKDTDYSAGYHTLLRKRTELEQTMMDLLTIQRDGAVLAVYNGGVYSVDYSEKTPTAVVTLSSDDRMSVTVDVDESDILSLSMGQRVTIKVPSVGSKSYDGLLMEVGRSATSAGTYSVVVELNKAEGMLPGMTANVSIQTQGVDGVLMIPVEAVHKTRKGSYVFTGYDAKRQEYSGKVDVVTGLENGTYVEIKYGLKIGDTVYYTEEESDSSGFVGYGSGQMTSFGGGSGWPNGGSGSSNRPTGNYGGGGWPSGGQMPKSSGNRG